MAYKYKKSDMVYDDYSTEATRNDDPKLTGEPDSSLFNRKELYEVLYLINSLGLNKEGCQEAEKLIHDELPGDIRSQEKVKNWIESEMS